MKTLLYYAAAAFLLASIASGRAAMAQSSYFGLGIGGGTSNYYPSSSGYTCAHFNRDPLQGCAGTTSKADAQDSRLSS